MKNTALTVSASIIAMMVSSQALGQVTQDEIIVTGQKRNESVQDVPVAITAVAGEDLEKQGIQRLDDIALVTPSLSITDSGLTQSVNIRGIGLASRSPNAANGVATYVDGVFQPPIVSTNSFFDIESIEVFRGPQGTFVGSNSTGGAIFINSRSPELGEAGGYIQGELGNYKRTGLELAANIPLGDTLAVRGAFNVRNRDSFYENSAGLEAPASLDEVGGRLGVYWEPSANFNALAKAEIIDKSTGGYAYRPIIGTVFASARTDNIYTLNYNTPTLNDENSEQYTARLEYITDGGITFRSISGYQNKEITNLYDSDGTNIASNTQNQYVRERVYTQEGNIISPDDQKFRWIVGGYYQKNKILVGIENDVAIPVHIEIDIENEKETTGVFGQVSYDFSDQFTVDVGGRYSTYDVVGTGAVQLALPPPPNGPGTITVADPGGMENDNQLTGKIALNWTPNADNLFYAFIAKGYKSGGFASPTTTFEPETVYDYEAGWKGTLADGAIRTQFGAFYYDYKNFQLDAIDQTTGRSALINLTDAEVYGMEMQSQAELGGFRVNVGLAFTDSSLAGTNFVDTRAVAFSFPGVSNAPQCPTGQASNPPACLDYTPFIRTTDGGPNLYSPKWTYNIGVEYPIALGNNKTLSPRLNYSHTGDRFTYIAYDSVRDRLASYDLLNGAVTLDVGEKYQLEFWATNLTNEEYSTGQTGVNEYYGAPREYGVRAKVNF